MLACLFACWLLLACLHTCSPRLLASLLGLLPCLALPCLALPCVASPRLASPHLASPRLASPRLALLTLITIATCCDYCYYCDYYYDCYYYYHYYYYYYYYCYYYDYYYVEIRMCLPCLNCRRIRGDTGTMWRRRGKLVELGCKRWRTRLCRRGGA